MVVARLGPLGRHPRNTDPLARRAAEHPTKREQRLGQEAPGSQWRFDITVDNGNDTEWIYRRDESTRRLWDSAVLWSSDGHPYLAPEIQLLFKSKNPRPKDDLDAEKVIPLLHADQRIFLADHLESGHHWRRLVNPR